MILLIEDRKQRLKQFEEQGQKLKDLALIKILDNIAISTVSEDFSLLDTNKIEVIIVHRSWLKDKGLYDDMVSLSKSKSIKLVLFSGGIVQVNYQKNDNLELLSLPMRMLYSANLLPFVENYTIDCHLLELAYGSRYELNEKLENRKKEWINQGEHLRELNAYVKKQLYV